MLASLALYLLCEYVEARKPGFRVWIKEGWTLLLLFHLLILLGFLASFAAAQILALFAPEFAPTLAANGYYDILGGPTAADEAGFFQLVRDYGSLFCTNDAAQQACIVFGSLAAITGCLLIAKLIPAIAGVEAKSLQVTFRKVKYYLLASSLGLLASLLIFVSLGNISFGAAISSFAGYYERQVPLVQPIPQPLSDP